VHLFVASTNDNLPIYLKRFSATNPALRFKVRLDKMFFAKTKFTRLFSGKKSQAGRNNTGRIVVRHHGSCRKRNFILIDFRRTFSTRVALCVNVRCDINRTALVGLLKYADGSFSYILISKGFFFGSFTRTCQFDVLAYKKFKLTYCVLLAKIPLTSIFFNIEVKLGDGGKYAKAAGTYCSIIWGDKEKELHLIKLPTGKLLVVSSFCFATLGKNGNY
jgi:large subunit ribosomal protein L2